jgi:hypothetical protein
MEWVRSLYSRRAVVRHCLLVRGFVRRACLNCGIAESVEYPDGGPEDCLIVNKGHASHGLLYSAPFARHEPILEISPNGFVGHESGTVRVRAVTGIEILSGYSVASKRPRVARFRSAAPADRRDVDRRRLVQLEVVRLSRPLPDMRGGFPDLRRP